LTSSGVDAKPPRTGRSAFHVGVGIFTSRIVGLVRSSVIAHYFGLGPVADAVSQAFRIPNILQNLFGDQALSASFIPVYSSLLAKGDGKEADRVAGAVASLLALVVAVLVLVGVFTTPLLIGAIVPGFTGARRERPSRCQDPVPRGQLALGVCLCLGCERKFRRRFSSSDPPRSCERRLMIDCYPGRSADAPGNGEAQLARRKSRRRGLRWIPWLSVQDAQSPFFAIDLASRYVPSSATSCPCSSPRSWLGTSIYPLISGCRWARRVTACAAGDAPSFASTHAWPQSIASPSE
jgi:hypothetical protein